jgi:carbamate kinase
VALAAEVVAKLAMTNQLVLTHGNGPQVGLLALQAAAYTEVAPYPLDVLGAESEGMIGYLLEQELSAHMPDGQVATLLTQVEVDAADPAFERPTKPIGPVYQAEQARTLARERGWIVAVDGAGMRRVVPSPQPRRIIGLRAIRLLLDAGVTVICVGGGGIPVVQWREGGYRGVEAVIDKDLSAALLAEQIDSEVLLMLTDVDAVYIGWGAPGARAIERATPDALIGHGFAEGSIGPKVEAARRYVESTGRRAAIGALGEGDQVLAGKAGTQVVAGIGRFKLRTG